MYMLRSISLRRLFAVLFAIGVVLIIVFEWKRVKSLSFLAIVLTNTNGRRSAGSVLKQIQNSTPVFGVSNIQEHFPTFGFNKTHGDLSRDSRERQQDITDIRVPNIVHFVWFTFNGNSKNFTFLQYLSVISASKLIRPRDIYFHTDKPPIGYYWRQVLELSNFHVVHRKPTTTIYGHAIETPLYENQASDLERLTILTETGGIYLDSDVLVTRSFDDLLKYDLTLGLESEDSICNAVIISKPSTPLLIPWIRTFVFDFKTHMRTYNAIQVPSKLFLHNQRFNSIINIEEKHFFRPNYNELDRLTSPHRKFDWKDNYVIHLWTYAWKWNPPVAKILRSINEQSISDMNTPIGEVIRFILGVNSTI